LTSKKSTNASLEFELSGLFLSKEATGAQWPLFLQSLNGAFGKSEKGNWKLAEKWNAPREYIQLELKGPHLNARMW